MKNRVVLFIKWRSDDGHFMISQYYVPEHFRDSLLKSEFSNAVRVLRCFALYPHFYDCNHIKRFITRLRSSFRFGWHIDAFSIYKKSLL